MRVTTEAAGRRRASAPTRVGSVVAQPLLGALDSRESTECPRSVTHRKIARRPSDGPGSWQGDRRSSTDSRGSVGPHGRTTLLLDRSPAAVSMIHGVDSGRPRVVLTVVPGTVEVTEWLTTWPIASGPAYGKKFERFGNDAGLSAIWWLSPVLSRRIPVVQITHLTGLRPVADLTLADSHRHKFARMPRALCLGTYHCASPSGGRGACRDEELASVLVPSSPFTSWVDLLRSGACGVQQDGVTSLTHRVEAA